MPHRSFMRPGCMRLLFKPDNTAEPRAPTRAHLDSHCVAPRNDCRLAAHRDEHAGATALVGLRAIIAVFRTSFFVRTGLGAPNRAAQVSMSARAKCLLSGSAGMSERRLLARIAYSDVPLNRSRARRHAASAQPNIESCDFTLCAVSATPPPHVIAGWHTSCQPARRERFAAAAGPTSCTQSA